MDLTFTNPWLWAGVITLAAPVWLHLRRKKERNLVRFAAVRFLEHQPRARRSPWRLRDVLLLVVRCIGALLVIAAFAGPYFRKAQRGQVKSRTVYILDGTMSRQAGAGFEADRARLLQELKAAGPESQSAVVELTATPRIVAGFTENPAAVLQEVRELKPSFQRGSYLAAFRQANSLLCESPCQDRRIVFLGDSQFNQWQETAGTIPFLWNVHVEMPAPGVRELPNLWLSEPRAQRIFVGQQPKLNLAMRLSHNGPARRAKVVVRVEGREVFTRWFDLDGSPESSLIQVQAEANSDLWATAEALVEGTPDALPADNHLFFAVPPLREGKVALLAQSPYLRLALSPEIMRGQWNTRVLDANELSRSTMAEADADVLCVESAFLQRPEVSALLQKYLNDGRGVFLILNKLSPAIDACLRQHGYEPIAERAAEPGKAEHFQFVSSHHSVFEPLLSPDFGNLMDVTVSGYAQVRAPAAHPLAFAASGAGLIFESILPRGKLLVCAFGLSREQTSWPIHPSFVPFLDSALQATRPLESIATEFEPGQVLTVEPPSDMLTRRVELRQDGRTVGAAAVENGRARIVLPDQPGLYCVASEDQRVLQFLSINAPAKESELIFSASDVPARQWSMSGPATKGMDGRMGLGVAQAAQQNLWWWLVAGALAGLVLETSLVAAKGETV